MPHWQECKKLHNNKRDRQETYTYRQEILGRLERLVELEDSFAKGIIISQTKRESQKLDTERGRLNKFFSGIKIFFRCGEPEPAGINLPTATFSFRPLK